MEIKHFFFSFYLFSMAACSPYIFDQSIEGKVVYPTSRNPVNNAKVALYKFNQPRFYKMGIYDLVSVGNTGLDGKFIFKVKESKHFDKRNYDVRPQNFKFNSIKEDGQDGKIIIEFARWN